MWLLVPALLTLSVHAAAPSLAAMSLEAKTGVTRDQAELITDNVIAALRDTRALSRVVSYKEMEGVLGLEQQKQLMECNSQTCLMEIAGALNVDLLMSGSVGQLGTEYLLNLRLINTRTGVGLASVSERVAGDVTKVLDRVRPAIDKLLSQGLQAAPVKQQPVPAAEVGTPRRPLRLGMAGVLLLGGVMGFLVGGALIGAGILTRVVAPGLHDSARYVPLWVPGWLGAVAVGALLGVTGVGVGVLGGAVGALGVLNP